jgi:preprotein translocase subunit SecA
LYEELRGFIRHQVAATIFRVTVTRQEEPRPLGVPVGVAAGAAGAAGGATTATAATGGAAAGIAAGAATVSRGLPAGPNVRAARESLGDRSVEGSSQATGARPGYTPSGQRIGRNDPCYCGSGLKYKKCHGR